MAAQPDINLTSSQRDAIEELRRRMEGHMEVYDGFDQTFVFYRFLKARNWDLNKAELMLKKSVQFRKRTYALTEGFQPPEIMLKYFHNLHIGYDKEGCQVIYAPLGKCDPKGIHKATKPADFDKTFLKWFSEHEFQLEQTIKKKNRWLRGLIIIIDCNGFILSNATYRKGIENMLRHLGVLQDNAPERLKGLILINNRVRDANVFEVVGIDLAGPLYLKSREKVWIVLFTCAIYRAVHLELGSSLSTEAFLLSLRRFIARRSRPKTIYTDNGTNFKGAYSELRDLDWGKITRETDILPIEWKFNPPTASWWGGWWERLVRVIKELLRRTLGNSVLTYEELLTVLCDCEAVINSRPLTYISEDPGDLLPLTPSLFLTGRPSFDVIDLDLGEFSKFQRRIKYRQKLLQDLRSRFRKEYLGSLVQKQQSTTSHEFRIGEIVLIEDPQKRRLHWPLGRVIGVLMGTDGKIRTLRIKTKSSVLMRPVQRVYSLEIQHDGLEECSSLDPMVEVVPSSSGSNNVNSNVHPLPDVCPLPVLDIIKNKITRSGRIVKVPNRLDLLNYTTCVFE